MEIVKWFCNVILKIILFFTITPFVIFTIPFILIFYGGIINICDHMKKKH